jgi:hypothetical protein
MPATVAEPDVGARRVPKGPDRGRLPRPVRTEEAEHLPVADLEGNVVEGDAVAEALAEVVDDEGRCGHRCPPLPRALVESVLLVIE